MWRTTWSNHKCLFNKTIWLCHHWRTEALLLFLAHYASLIPENNRKERVRIKERKPPNSKERIVTSTQIFSFISPKTLPCSHSRRQSQQHYSTWLKTMILEYLLAQGLQTFRAAHSSLKLAASKSRFALLAVLSVKVLFIWHLAWRRVVVESHKLQSRLFPSRVRIQWTCLRTYEKLARRAASPLTCPLSTWSRARRHLCHRQLRASLTATYSVASRIESAVRRSRDLFKSLSKRALGTQWPSQRRLTCRVRWRKS